MMINRKIPGVCMIEHDLAELYTYLDLFNKVYGGYEVESDAIKTGILEIYSDEYGVADADAALRQLRNPRSAGRKSLVTDDAQIEVLRLREEGLSIRALSRSTGLSKSTVQHILAEAR